MIRFVFKFTLCLLLALATGFAYLALRSGDPAYTLYEWMSPARFQQEDSLITAAANEHDLDPMLVKATTVAFKLQVLADVPRGDPYPRCDNPPRYRSFFSGSDR